MTGGFKDHFSERAAGYASYRPHYPPELAAWLASIAPRREVAWDVACGSGQLSTLLGDHFQTVVATDASAAQIGQAQPHANVEYRVEPAEATSLADDSIDLITVAQAAHWFNLPPFYREARRVGRPGAAIALVAYGIAHIDPEVDRVVDGFYSGDLEGFWPPERSHIETGYRDLEFPFARIDAPSFDMRVTWTADQMLGYIHTWSAVRAMEAKNGSAVTERFTGQLRQVWGPDARLVTWPIVVLAGRVVETTGKTVARAIDLP